MEHTALPWAKIPRNRKLAGGRGPGFDLIGPVGASTWDQTVIADKLSEDDADKVLRAVNNYDHFVDCLEQAAFVLDAENSASDSDRVQVLEEIRAALSAARETTH